MNERQLPTTKERLQRISELRLPVIDPDTQKILADTRLGARKLPPEQQMAARRRLRE
jgi:hypothetical protein